MHPGDEQLIQYALERNNIEPKLGVKQLQASRLVEKPLQAKQSEQQQALQAIKTHQAMCRTCREKIAEYAMLIEQLMSTTTKHYPDRWLTILQRLNLGVSYNQDTIYNQDRCL